MRDGEPSWSATTPWRWVRRKIRARLRAWRLHQSDPVLNPNRKKIIMGDRVDLSSMTDAEKAEYYEQQRADMVERQPGTSDNTNDQTDTR